jgi:hypothetical protein
LKPPEEEKVREHLGSCQNCEKEWKEFRQMMGRLHSVEEEEVPEGFLSEIQKKREERKGKERTVGDRFFRSMKVPIQAMAMVMIVFLALYLTQMAPFEMLQKKVVEKSEVPYSEREKKGSVLKEEEKQKVTSPPPALYRKDYLSEAKPSATDEREGAKDGIAQKMKEEDKKLPAPPFKEEMATAEPLRPKEMAKAEAPPLEEKRREREKVGTVIMSLAKKPAREITLKISDREKAVSQVQELAKQLGGEVVREDGDVLLATLPASSYGEFEKGLVQIGSSPVFPKATAPKEMKDDLSLAAGAKSKEPIFIRIHLVPE